MVKFLDKQEKYSGVKRADSSEWEIKYSCHMTEPEINRLCEEILIWARITDCYRATSLFHEFEIHSQSFYEWCDKFPQLGKAYKDVKFIFAERRERGVFEGKYNPGFVLATHHQYDPEYAAWKEKLAATKGQSGGGASAIVNVSMDKMPETDIVPIKEEPLNDDD